MTRFATLTAVLIVTIFLTTTVARGQTEIKETSYKVSFIYDCFSYSYDIKLPIIKMEEGDQNVRKIINDTSLSIINFYRKEMGQPYESSLDCPQIYSGTEETNIDYKVTCNTDSLLSISIMQTFVHGNGGHGADQSISCFNLDLLHHKTLTIDSLFNRENFQKFSNYLNSIKARLMEKQGREILDFEGFDFFASHSPYVQYRGFNLDSTNLILHYSAYHESSLTGIHDISIPLTEVKRFIDKKYLWLCGTDKKKK